MNWLAAEPSGVTPNQMGWTARMARRVVLDRLASIESGGLELREGPSRLRFGDPNHGLQASIRVNDEGFFRAILLGGSLGAAESYLQGEWDSKDLAALVRVMARNRSAITGLDGGVARLGELLARAYHWSRANTISGSRKNIAAHYDLGNELFERFLDPTMTYSCAYFENPSVTLEAAQTAKIDRICRKLQLQPSDHLLEIGTGWGGFALYAASRYGCRVTTTTISPSQYREASRRVASTGMTDQIQILQTDYRDLDGVYDKLVSVEMIEAVGHEFFETFFSTCSARLKPDGLMAIQAITIADRNYEEARRSVDFIQRYIFPGGALPSVAAMSGAVASASDLTPMHLEEMGLHYATTLQRWRERFDAEWPRLAEAGFEERFRRLWHYYFAYCEGGFLERVIGLVQMVFAKPGFRTESLRGRL